MKHAGLILALLVASVLGSTTFAQTPTPTAARSDLAVASITLLGPPPAWRDGAPTSHGVHVVVENHGSVDAGPYRIDYRWLQGGQETWLNGDETRSFDVHEGPIASRGHHNHTLQWTLQPQQSGDGAIRVRISPINDADATNDQRTLALPFIPVHQVELTILGAAQDIRPDETRFVRVSLRNPGNLAQPLELRLPNATRGDALRLDETLDPASATLGPGATLIATLFATYPFAGDQRAFSVQHDVEALTAYGKTLKAQTPPFVGRHDALPPPSAFTLMRVEGGTIAGGPAATTNITFRLRNEGTDQDVYLIDAESDPGWSLLPNRTRIGLNAGESAEFDARIVFPADLAIGATSTAQIEVRSHRSATPTRIPLDLRITGPSIRLTPAAGWPGPAYVGDPIRVPIHVSNTGDQSTILGSNVTVLATGPDETTMRASIVVPPLAPGQTTSVVADVGTYGDGGTTTLAAHWASPNVTVANQGFQQQVLVHEPLARVHAPASLTGIAGELLTYGGTGRSFRVENAGNAPETFNLSAATNAGSAVLEPALRQIQLAPGEVRSIPIQHRLPSPAGHLTSTPLRLEAFVAGRNATRWAATVETILLDTQAPRLADVSVPGLWDLHGTMPLRVRAIDDGVVVRVQATHTAPSGASRAFELSSEDGENWTGTTVPGELGNHTLAFRAWDAFQKSTTSVPRTTRIERIPPPSLILEGPAEGSHVLPSDAFRVQVNDSLEILVLEVQIVDEHQRVLEARSLTRNETGVAEFSLHGIRAGRVGLIVRAMNVAGAVSSQTRTVVLEVPAASESPSVPQDVPSSSTPPATGSGAPSPGLAGSLLGCLLALALARRRSSR